MFDFSPEAIRERLFEYFSPRERFQIIEDPYLETWYKKPKAKKKRILKKWWKRIENRKPDTRVWIYGNKTFVCHPMTAYKLRKELEKSIPRDNTLYFNSGNASFTTMEDVEKILRGLK